MGATSDCSHLSTGLSSLGDELAPIALTIKVAELTDSGWAVAALLLCGVVPPVDLRAVGRVIVDNYETRRTLAIATAIQAALAVGLAFLGRTADDPDAPFLLGTASAVENRRSTPSCRAWSAKSTPPGNAYLEAPATRA